MAKKDKPFNYAQADRDELNARLNRTQQDLFKLRFRAASAPANDTMQIRKLRREVARLHTFINQKPAAPKTPVAAGQPAAKAGGKAKGK